MSEWGWIVLAVVIGIAIIALPIALVGILVTRVVRRPPGREDSHRLRGFTPVRLYQYLVSFAGLVAALVGLSFLLQRFFEELAPSDALLANPSETRFAIGLAMLVLGGIVWSAHWLVIQRNLKAQGAAERSSAERSIYLRLTAFVAMVFLFIALARLFRWATTADGFSGYPFAATLVWGVAWAAHQRMADREMEEAPGRDGLWQLGVYVTSLYTLAVGVAGAAGILNELFSQARESLLDGSPILVASGFDTEAVQGSLGLFIAGGVAWACHWLYLGRRDRESAGRAVAGFLAGLGATVTLVVSASVFLFGITWWFLAPAGDLVAGLHYRFLSSVLAALVPASLVAGYFHIDFHNGAGKIGDRAAAARNLLLGVLSLLGLVALATSVVFFVGSFFGALSQPARGLIVNDDWWRRPIAIGISTAALGVPLWAGPWIAWRRLGERVNRDFLRAYLYLVIGVAMLAVLGSGAHALYSLLRDFVDDKFQGSWLREARWSIGVLIAAGACAFYHWRVTREEAFEAKAPMPQPGALAPAVQVRIIGLAAASETLAGLRAVLGEAARVAEERTTGEELARLPLAAIAALPDVLRAYAGKRLLLVVTKDEVRVYEDS